jgi:hypothetical protein
MGQDEGMGLAGGDGEIGDRAQILAPHRHGAGERQQMGAGDGSQHAAGPSADPGHGDAVVEAQHQLGMDRHAPGAPDDPAHDAAVGPADRHEIHDGDDAAAGLEAGVEHQAAVAIMARHFRRRLGRDLPAAMLGPAQ